LAAPAAVSTRRWSAQVRAFAVSTTPGNRRRTSIAFGMMLGHSVTGRLFG
jgi:hypothetical protein